MCHVSLSESSFDQLAVLSTALIPPVKNIPFYNKPQIIEILSPNRAVHLIKLFRSAEARDPSFSAFATLLPCCLYSSTLLPIPSPNFPLYAAVVFSILNVSFSASFPRGPALSNAPDERGLVRDWWVKNVVKCVEKSTASHTVTVNWFHGGQLF